MAKSSRLLRAFTARCSPRPIASTTAALLAGCTENHFSIQIRDYHNRTEAGHETLVWGAVIGIGETFTPVELISFPLYVLRNHGSTWNDLEWTWWVILAGVIPGFWLDRYLARRWFGWRWCSVFDRQMTLEPRAWLCELAILAFAATMIEKVVHLVYAQTQAEWGYQFWVGLLAVAGFSNGFPILIQFFIYRGLYHRDDKWVTASTRWWPLELALGHQLALPLWRGLLLGARTRDYRRAVSRLRGPGGLARAAARRAHGAGWLPTAVRSARQRALAASRLALQARAHP